MVIPDPDPNSWAGVIADLLVQYDWSQSELARRIGVSQQTISAWLTGYQEVPSIQTVHAVYKISGDSMLRLMSVAYGWPMEEIAQRAVLDAVLVDEAVHPQMRGHLVRQYNYLLWATRAVRELGIDIDALMPPEPPDPTIRRRQAAPNGDTPSLESDDV